MRARTIAGPVIACILAAAAMPGGTKAAPSARAHVVAALNAWPGAWERRDADAICDLFARDAVLSFPNSADRDYATACRQFRHIAADRSTTSRYDRPQIQQVDVSGGLATVRLIWTATVHNAAGTVIERTREQGLDVLRRGRDGRWRITISLAYPL
jgi:uncharacterized protein (TIGR02246 family)